MFWLRLAQEELEYANWRADGGNLSIAQKALQCAANGLLYPGNDPARSRRDAAVT